jgi:hypothetical protein
MARPYRLLVGAMLASTCLLLKPQALANDAPTLAYGTSNAGLLGTLYHLGASFLGVSF